MAQFVAGEDGQRYSAAIRAAVAALGECGFAADGRTWAEPLEALRYRLPAQSRMIESNRGLAAVPPGIYYDADNELAVYYFALDLQLLTEIENASLLG
jgi:hypothetical protein